MCKSLQGQGDRASQSPMGPKNHGWFSRRDMFSRLASNLLP